MRASISFSHLFFRAAVLMIVLFLATVNYAQITPLGDSYINTAAPTTNYGAKTLLDVDGATQITYIQFDLSSIPSGYTGSNIAKASLKLYVNAVTTAGSFNVDYVNGSWTESTIDASNAPPPGATIAASVAVAKSQVHDYIIIDITPAVEAWLNGTETNYGIALVANSTFNASFDSKESTSQSQPAELDIVFAGSGGGGITGVLTGAGSGLQGGGTSGTLNLSLITSCASNQILQWSGSAWACSSAGTGTITGVTAGTDLTGGGTTGNVTLNLDLTKVPQLGTPNTFTGNQTVNGNVSATGLVTGAAYNIGSNLFAFGSYANSNAFLGFAGNSTMSGTWNTATGTGALLANTTGNYNTSTGAWTLTANTTGSNNTAAGVGALNANTAGTYNTGTGSWALTANTTGDYNTATGGGALNANTTGAGNTATGVNALWVSTTGNNNTADGSNALHANTTGYGNTASGSNALSANTTGYNNTADGGGALPTNTTGSDNTASGSNAGTTLDSSAMTGPNNTFLGNNSAASTGALANATAIGSNAVVSESNALVLGCTVGLNSCPAAVSVGIGTATPAYTLDVQGSGRFTQPIVFASSQTFPGAGTITGVTAGTDLTGGGTSGNVTLNVDTTKVVTGVVAGTDLTGGGTGGVQTLNLDTTKVPQLAAANTFTGNQTVNGNLSATGTVTGSSFGIGSNLFAFGSYSAENAFLGFAGNTTMTGTGNTASGNFALNLNTTGSNNTASGTLALYSNTTGSNNTASGTVALYSNTTGYSNTASGVNALSSNTTGSYNTANGAEALYYNTTGGANTASGFQALYANTGNGNVAVGYYAGYNITNGSNNIDISNYGQDFDSGVIRIGTQQTAAYIAGIYGVNLSSGNAVYVNSNGQLGILSSSRRFKQDIRDLGDTTKQVMGLRPVRFRYKTQGSEGPDQYGLIAEEVNEVSPDLVGRGQDGQIDSVRYDKVNILLLSEVQKQHRMIQAQQTTIKAQQAAMKLQQAQIDQLMRQVREVQAALKAIAQANSAVRTVKTEVTTVRQ